jgi:hypothetical protein
LIDRYQKNGVSDVSHIFYDGVRHEPMNDFGRDQFHADVVTWLEQYCHSIEIGAGVGTTNCSGQPIARSFGSFAGRP